MVMYMDGFSWSLKGGESCINLYFGSWTLDTRGKFFLGMVGVVLLGFFTEFVSRLRHDLAKKAKGSANEDHFKYSLLQTGLHGLHALSGYLLMLATMTFSCELMLSVIAGLMTGYYHFGGATFNTSNPCCAFLEDESDAPTGYGATDDAALEPLLPRSDSEQSASDLLLDGECCRNGAGNSGDPEEAGAA